MCESTFWIKMSNIPSDIIVKHKININLTTKYLFQIRRKKEKRKETPFWRVFLIPLITWIFALESGSLEIINSKTIRVWHVQFLIHTDIVVYMSLDFFSFIQTRTLNRCNWTDTSVSSVCCQSYFGTQTSY